ncbi:hypothetical protein EV421DRAFT_1908582 [Armillaria borealis]|uniref:Uncharacterized protein n=1 Tax=Armillaria borealis TaxID=47425 RepID=A0AA39J573_9AGAR|nr:hypothetical protein EV421DRAFT_1908582 [Armillaria borealis]
MQPVPAGYPIETLSGPVIVGYLLHWGLFGTLSVQMYLYYLAFLKDTKFTKCLIYGIYIVKFVQMMLTSYDTFKMFGYCFGDIEALTAVDFYWLAIPIMSGIGCVQHLLLALLFLIFKGAVAQKILQFCSNI